MIDLCAEGWGFSLGIIDAEIAIDRTATGHSTVLNHSGFSMLPFGSTPGTTDNAWKLRGPFPSTGMKNSLEGVLSAQPPLGGEQVERGANDILVITDYDLLMRSEQRTMPITVEMTEPLVMGQDEYLIFDLGNVYFGYITLDGETTLPQPISSTAGACVSTSRVI